MTPMTPSPGAHTLRNFIHQSLTHIYTVTLDTYPGLWGRGIDDYSHQKNTHSKQQILVQFVFCLFVLPVVTYTCVCIWSRWDQTQAIARARLGC